MRARDLVFTRESLKGPRVAAAKEPTQDRVADLTPSRRNGARCDLTIRDAGACSSRGSSDRRARRKRQAPPKYRTRCYLFEQITHPNLLVRVMSERIGDASGVKMCYAAMTKGTTALAVELLVAARKLGVEQALEKELRDSRSDVFDWQMKSIPSMPPKAYRWVPEMQEIAKTFGELGMTRRIFEGATDMYELIAATPLGKESPEQARKAGRTGLDVTRGADGKCRYQSGSGTVSRNRT